MVRCPPTRRQALGAALAVSILVGPACDEEQQEPDTTEAEERIVYENTHKTLATVPLLMYVAELFAADPSWGTLDPAVGARVAVGVTRSRIELILSSLECERELTTDGETWLAGTFSNCRVSELDLGGSFRAELQVETGACTGEPVDPDNEDAECLTAVNWTLGENDLAVTDEVKDGASRFLGPITLRDTVVEEAPMTWETQGGFSVQAADGEPFGARSSAAWTLDKDTNCLDIDVDARLELPELETEDYGPIELGEIVISAAAVHFCPTHCPTAGGIEMSFGRGAILSWEYDGSDEVEVTGPMGRSFTAPLPCPPAPE